jgi:hypothetical protein
LATTDVMLASTVQFSRYGRSRPSARPCGRGGRSWPRGPRGRSLRTQQRARPANPSRAAFRPLAPGGARGVLADVSWYTDRITSAPLVSCHLRTHA